MERDTEIFYGREYVGWWTAGYLILLNLMHISSGDASHIFVLPHNHSPLDLYIRFKGKVDLQTPMTLFWTAPCYVGTHFWHTFFYISEVSNTTKHMGNECLNIQYSMCHNIGPTCPQINIGNTRIENTQALSTMPCFLSMEAIDQNVIDIQIKRNYTHDVSS